MFHAEMESSLSSPNISAPAPFSFFPAYGGLVPTYSLICREHFSTAELGSRIGVIYLFGTIGMALGGVAGGLVFDSFGSYRIAFAIGIAFNLANLALIVPLTIRERRLNSEVDSFEEKGGKGSRPERS